MKINRRAALSAFLGVGLTPLLARATGAQSARAGLDASAHPGGVEIRQYTYKNSLWDHAPGYGRQGWGDDETSAANWVARLVAHSNNGDTFRENAEFGFRPEWEVPPRLGSRNVHSAELAGYVANSWTNMGQVNRVMFVPDNFVGWTKDPAEQTHVGPVAGFQDALLRLVDRVAGDLDLSAGNSYQDALLRLIDAWEANAPCMNGERAYLVYAGWPATSAQDPQVHKPGPAEIAAWRERAIGEYQDWYDLLTERLRAERPQVRVAQVPANRVAVKTYLDTVLNAVPVERMFEDESHGRETWYCLVGAIYYMSVFGKKAPADYVPPPEADVHPLLTENWTAVTDFAWAELNGASDVN